MKERWLVTSYTDLTKLAHLPKGTPGTGITTIQQGQTTTSDYPDNFAFMLAHLTLPNIWYGTIEGIDQPGQVVVFTQQQDRLVELQRSSAGGRSTCYLHYDPKQDWLIVVNYWDSNFRVYQVLTDGTLGCCLQTSSPDPWVVQHQPDRTFHWKYRQRWSHQHCCVVEPYHDTLFYFPDLGLDQIRIRKRNPDGTGLLEVGQVSLPTGKGPRHLVFHPHYQVGYLVNELDSTVTVLSYLGLQQPWLQSLQNISSLPSEFTNDMVNHGTSGWRAKSHSSEIRIHPNGKFVYVANRGHDSLCHYRVQPSGKLEYVATYPSGGLTPRNFNFNQDGSTMCVANQDSDLVVVFQVDDQSGVLTQIDQISVASPNYVATDITNT